MDIGDLNKIYTEAESVDSAHFAEIRTNYLLYIGDHFRKTANKFISRYEDKLDEKQKLKISENHIGVCANRVINSVMSQSQSITAVPQNEKELRDQKDAELCNAVVKDSWVKQDFEKKLERMTTDCVVPGEFCMLQYFDPHKGKQIGWEQASDEEGNPLFTAPTGEPVPYPTDELGNPYKPHPDKKKPKFEGEIAMDVINPADVKRKANADSMDNSEVVIITRMMATGEALMKYTADPENSDDEKVKFIKGATGSTFKVFNQSQGSYEDSKDQIVVRQYFFRQCYRYPKGYFYIATEAGILSEGELPFGIWPIYFDGWLEVSTSPRFKSKIKDARIPQLELNRLLSQHAYHTLALGDAKVITQMGSKLQKGSTWTGVREFQVNGPPPVIMPGSGAEWLNAPIERSVQSIYKIFDLDFELKSENQGQDLMVSLYKDGKQKEKFSPIVRKMQRALNKIWETHIQLAKAYYQEDRMILIAGKREAVNIAEFKNISETGYQFEIKGSSKDLNEMYGKSLAIEKILQYAGKDMDKRQMGRIIRMMPMLNQDQMVNEMTIDDENVDSDILALDRGEDVMPQKYDDHDYYIKRLTHRMKMADFRNLDPMIQQRYAVQVQQREELKAQQIQEMKRLESEMIPTGGALITCSVHVPDPEKGPGATRQLRVPYESLLHLVKQLESQGSGQEQLAQQNDQVQSDIANKAMELFGNGQPVGMQQTDWPMPQQQMV